MAPNAFDPNSIKAIINANIPQSLDELFPSIRIVRGLSRDDIQSDIIAGLTVAVMVVPQGMAYAALAQLTPEIGLYSCIMPILVYSVIGSSRQLAVGPVAMVALLTSAGLSELQDPLEDPVRYQRLASTLALVVGLLQACMGLLRLEFIARFLPHPVLSGFTSAAAIVIGCSQLKDLFKLSLPRSERLQDILDAFFNKIGDTHGLTVGVAISAIVFLLGAKQVKKRVAVLKRFPEALFLVVFFILVSYYADFEGKGVKVIGKVPAGFPAPQNVLWNEMGNVLGPALSIALVGFLESFAVAKTIAEKEGYPMSAQRELIGLGLANVVGAFFKSMPTTGGFSRSAVNYQAGAKSTLSSLVTALFMIITVLALTPLFTDLPKPILSAIIVVAVATLVDVGEFVHLWKTDKRDFVLVCVAFACTLFWGLLEGILVSAGLAIVILVQRVASPHSAVLVQICEDPPTFRNRDRYPDGKALAKTLIFRMDAPLFYANAESFKDRLNELILESDPKVIIVHGGAMPHVDSSGVAVLKQVRERCVSRGKILMLCEFNGPTRDQLEIAHVAAETFLTLNEAVTRAKALVETSANEDVSVFLTEDSERRSFDADARTVVSANDC
jgi:SulP family sulfate permease